MKIQWTFLFVVLLAAIAPRGAGADQPLNVVFFLVDDLGWRDIGCYGSEFHLTPHLDAFAKRSVRFTNAYAACHVCSPTRAAIMTGKYPAKLGLTDWLQGRRDFPFQRLETVKTIQALPSEEITIAEHLKRNGYRTGHFGKWHLGEEPSHPLAHGFDVQVPRGWNKGWPRNGYHAPFSLGGIADKPGQYLTDRLTDEALKFIDESKESPFFLYLSHFAVHDPIQGRKDLVEKAKKRKRSLPTHEPEFVLEGNPDDPTPLDRNELKQLISKDAFAGYHVLPQRTVKIKQRQDNPEFAGMVESMDESFGRVIAKLRELDIADRTIVIFTSDNGGMSGANLGNPNRIVDATKLDLAYSTSNLPLRGAKGWLYEGGIRVPAMVRWPGQHEEGIESDIPITSVDYLPSVIEMTGLSSDTPKGVDGVSFVPALKGESEGKDRPIFWHFPHYSNHGMQSPGGAIRLGKYKLLDYFEKGTLQLFDLSRDIGEQHDLSDEMPEKAAELHAMLVAWRKTVGATMCKPNPNYEP